MRNKASVVIIGGGISGCAIAWNLAARGERDVVVLEKSYLCSGSTGRCGAGVRMQWGTDMNCRLSKKSIEFYEHANEILEYPGDVEFKQKGYLLVADTAREMEQFKKNLAVQRRHGIPSRLVTPGEAGELVPHLNADVLLGGAYCPKDGFLNPFKTTDAFYRAAKRLGVGFCANTTVTGIDTEGGRVRRVRTDRGDVETARVVVAAGGMAGSLASLAGAELPVYPERHHILVTEPVEPMQDPMVMAFALNLYVQQSPQGSFLMGRGDENEPRDGNVRASWRFLEEMAKSVEFLLPKLAGLRVVRQWAGLYTMSPDRQPIYGQAREVEGLYFAAGFSGHGFMFGPVTGIAVSEMVLGLAPSIDVSELFLERFERGHLVYEPAVV
ncbi:MAG: Sarcosine oxidase subunit beta [Firmicutes bacterium ADurb.Bin248]|nr:MAG: Sarcosine oxidase subunit beta [Firmicutes bacterium ADurb.Bin248]HOF99584.1 FAD-binding oxidoreductase [Clostridia bacterium]HPK14542.1 FAD-binding oxidoreductase [Clostridia bacterium]